MSFNNTLGIKYDAKFVRLVNRLLYEHAQVRSSDQAMSNLKNSNLLSRNLSDILSNKNKEMKEQSETTLKHIFKYIDRRVERAVLEERKVQEVGKLKELYKKFDKNKSDELMSFKTSGLVEGVDCPSESLSFSNTRTHHIFAVPLPSCFVDNLLKDIKKEILKINSGMLLLKSNHLDVISRSFEDDSSMMIEISFSFVYDNYPEKFAVVLTSDGSPVEVCSAKIAKQLSDEVNKIARDKYANCL